MADKTAEKQNQPLLPQSEAARSHTLVLDNRRSLCVTGVLRVISCDETGVALQTPLGDLSIGGQGLQVSELSVRSGEVRIQGKIEYLQYAENRESAGGLLARLFH